MDSREDTKMLNFFIGYCSGHYISRFSESLVIRIEFAFGPKERLYATDLSNENRFCVYFRSSYIDD